MLLSWFQLQNIHSRGCGNRCADAQFTVSMKLLQMLISSPDLSFHKLMFFLETDSRSHATDFILIYLSHYCFAPWCPTPVDGRISPTAIVDRILLNSFAYPSEIKMNIIIC